MAYKRNDKSRFINPYTFVPIQREQKIRREPLRKDRENLHTGVLHCRLRVVTPVGIPDAERAETENDHTRYPFFSYEKEGKRVLAIPGSSLRGPIRSVYEAATDSCFSTLREDTRLSKRTEMRQAYRPGILYLREEGPELYEAERYLMAVNPNAANAAGNTDRDYTKLPGLKARDYIIIERRGGERKAVTSDGFVMEFGAQVEFSIADTDVYRKNGRPVWSGYACNIRPDSGDRAGAGRKKGIVYIGETFIRKKHGESIFSAGRKLKWQPEELERAYQGLLESLEIYRDKAINRSSRHSGYQGFERAAAQKAIPVWYSERDKKLSLASIGRTFFNSSLNDLAGDHIPCTSREHLCEACSLFGMAQTESLGSRVRITDAVMVSAAADNTKEVCLKILGQPRYSYLPFYARQQSGSAVASYDDKGVDISGRKFYWHNEEARENPEIYTSASVNKMNDTLELVQPGAEFAFEIYYEEITQKQLDRLLWTLHFGENKLEDARYCHKIGRGKPLGLGSVKIMVESRSERSFTDGRYCWKEAETGLDGRQPDIRNRDKLLKVSDLCGAGGQAPIMYPDVLDHNGQEFGEERSNKNARHMWYSENRRGQVQTLPDLMEKDQSLARFQEEPDRRR